MNIILIGFGNVGKETKKVLEENNHKVDFVVRGDGVYNSQNQKVDEKENFYKYIDDESIVFISTPSVGEGEISAEYYKRSLELGAKIVTCEKAFLAHNWEFIKNYPGKIKYSATVGGNSGILSAISDYGKEITDIKGVVNGTLNYIGEKLSTGANQKSLYKEVTEKGFAEPGSSNFGEVVDSELKDVRLKATILTNHSHLYPNIIKPEDIALTGYREGFRAGVKLDKDSIQAGFVLSEKEIEFPIVVNNVLYINGGKVAEGPGAGARATAERKFNDFKRFN